jgi:alginate O-acetyltransferase complex protein AlgI
MVAQTAEHLARMGIDLSGWEAVALPVGISFFTFQKLSYTIDVYRGRCRSIANVIDFSMYVALFPQLVAGPIVRFRDIYGQIRNRVESWEMFYAGAVRFCWGLCKKVILADTCGRFADAIFSLSPAVLDTKTAWMGALAYTLQIYLDFSAYSDMAIGLGMLFGFRFLENFNRPYSAVSLTDFWRRWHISLSRWFRDYLYVPLGGNRKGAVRTYLNLTIVFLLCGFWHGANWTFVVWGAYHGLFLVVERMTGLRRIPEDRMIALRRLVTLLVVVCGWVIFRCDDLGQAGHFFAAMFSLTTREMPIAIMNLMDLKNTMLMLCSATTLILPSEAAGCRAANWKNDGCWWPQRVLSCLWCCCPGARRLWPPAARTPSSITGFKSYGEKVFLSILCDAAVRTGSPHAGGPSARQPGQHGPPGVPRS